MSEETELKPSETTNLQWLIACGAITALASFVRLYWLTLKPLHHDEGVNGFFLTNLVRDGVYKYDPANYHGPTLYYISLAFTELFGLTTTSVRVSVAIWGILIVVLTYWLRNYLGNVGSLVAAAFLALSPGMTYISRYFIHEIFFVFLSLTIVMSVVFFIEKRKAGPFAVGWMAFLLMVAFSPSVFIVSSALASAPAAVWAFRIAFLLIEGALVYLVIKMLRDWDNGRPVYLLLASASVALFFATKETAFITLGTMLIACICIWIWQPIANGEAFQKNRNRIAIVAGSFIAVAAVIYRQKLVDGGSWLYDFFLGEGRVQEPLGFYLVVSLIVLSLAVFIVTVIYLTGETESEIDEPAVLTFGEFKRALGVGNGRLLIFAATFLVFVYLTVLFFSSFFTYAEGVGKAIEAYAIWSKTGTKDHTQNGFLGYLRWGMKVESPVLLVSAIGALIAIIRAKHRFAMFTALWAFGLFLAYSIIPYKTPWLALSFLLPMCLIAGYGINELVRSNKLHLKAAAVALGALSIVILAYQSYSINFVRYDDEEMAYVYAHSKREMLNLVDRVNYYAEKSGKGNMAKVAIVSPDYWPLTWYFNDMKEAVFHGGLTDGSKVDMIIAKKNDQDAEVIRRYSSQFKFAGVYPLRPGVDLVLLVRRELADEQEQNLYKLLEYKDKN